MTFKEELQKDLGDARLKDLETNIAIHRNMRYHSVDMQPGVDVVHSWLCFGYKLLPPGQAIWDKFVSLGFSPVFTWGHDWGGPCIFVRW